MVDFFKTLMERDLASHIIKQNEEVSMLNIFSMSLKFSRSSHSDDCDSTCASSSENDIPSPPGDCNSDCSYTCTDSESEGIGGGGDGGDGYCWVCTGTCLQQCADYSYMSSK